MRLEYFQLIDRIVDLSVGEGTITAEAIVPTTSTVFEGHFPGHPLMPGLILIESMAQTCGWLVIAAMRFKRMPFLAQVKEARLRNFVPPGRTLSIKGKLVHEGSGYALASAKITADKKPVCDAELMFRVMPFPTPELQEKMRD